MFVQEIQELCSASESNPNEEEQRLREEQQLREQAEEELKSRLKEQQFPNFSTRAMCTLGLAIQKDKDSSTKATLRMPIVNSTRPSFEGGPTFQTDRFQYGRTT
ncbi:uncharacterized protein ATNIH1004_006578 [Aspergillus tanneri]|uniref:Uncharacterized protein n=1 Tax=Aspergillus tanneri TaxID=1220188 RepID=A0A5M9MPR0_9EURO|nr:uncharacterized protein ATNIH1004_006578 [Aspergillus tanneri]KAA8647876.1 hypothetical protein ATNIH1004_006578 [Aspergillus tanneri]